MAQVHPEANNPGHVAQLNELSTVDWSILDTCSGLLDDDELLDMVVVLQARDSDLVVIPWPGHHDTIFAQRRTAMVFHGSATGGFDLWTKNDHFIPLHHDRNSEDPFSDVRINDHRLIVVCRHWQSLGSWWTGSWTYTCKPTLEDLMLVKATYSSIHRASHEGYDYTFDLSSGLFTLIENAELKGEGRMKRSEGTIPMHAPKAFSELNPQGTWEIIPDVFI